MPKHADKSSYKVIFETLPTSGETVVYYDKSPIEIPFYDDFPYLHYHDRYEIGICKQGRGIILCDGEFYSVGEGDLIFVKDGSHHYSRSLTDVEPFLCRYMYVTVESVKKLLGSRAEIPANVKIPTVISDKKYPEVAQNFLQIDKLCDDNDRDIDIKVPLRLAALILDLQTCFETEITSTDSKKSINGVKDELAERVARFIALYYSCSHSTKELARLVHISESQLRRRFIKAYGMPPIAYRSYLRAGIGAELLLRTDMSVFEIAERLGYTCPSDFYRIFVKCYGVSPAKYRKNTEFK